MADWTIQLDPPAVATNRTMLDLSNVPGNMIQVDAKGIDWGDASITAYMANEQRWGSTPVSYRVPNRNVQIPLFLGADAASSGELARSQLQQKVALFQRRGGWLLRQRKNGSPLYADVVNATLNVPDIWMERGGIEPNVVLTLECLPDFYGDPIGLDTVTGTGETQAVLTSGGATAAILGDYPGRVTLTPLDGSNNQQFGLIWGFRSYNYNAATNAGLAYAASTLTPGGGAVVSALSGARGGQAMTLANISSSGSRVGSYSWGHQGAYTVWVRVYTASPGTTLQWLWGVGALPTAKIQNPMVAVPGTSNFYLVNLGQVRIDPVPVGAQIWTGALNAFGTGAIYWDMVYFVPLEEASGFLSGVALDASNPILLASGRAQLRWDSMYRATTAGTFYTPIAQVYGDLPRIPPSGLENKPVQLFMKPSRGDLFTYPDSGTDTFSCGVGYRPSYMFRP